MTKRYCNLITSLTTIAGEVTGPGELTEVTPSRREANKQRNRDRLFDAALELFGARGYAAVSVEDICSQADVGRATFFRLYGTKSGLLLEFNRRLAVKARARVVAGHPPDAAAALRIVQEVMCEEWTNRGAALRDMVHEYLNTVSLLSGTRDSSPDLQALVAEIIRDGQRRGEFVAEPAAEFGAWLVVLSLSSAVTSAVGSPETLERRSRQALTLLFGGLQATRTSSMAGVRYGE